MREPGAMKDDPAVLALESNLEDALFSPSECYLHFQERADEVLAAARAVVMAFPDALPEVSDEVPWSPWLPHVGSLLKFVIGPLMAGKIAADAALRDTPHLVRAAPDHYSHAWWTGRDISAALASYVADACHAPLIGERFPWTAIARFRPELRLARLALRRRMSRLPSPPAPEATGACDALFLIEGPTLLPFYRALAPVLQREHELTAAAIPVLPPPRQNEPWVVECTMPPHLACSTPALRRSAFRTSACALARIADLRSAVDGIGGLSELHPALRDAAARRLGYTMVAELPQTLHDGLVWRQLLSALKPTVIVGFNADSSLLAPAIHAARSLGIATVCCQHGIWGPTLRATTLLPYDRVAVFAPYAATMLGPLAQSGATQFEVTGNPLYDARAATSDSRSPRSLVVAATQPSEGLLRAREQWCWLARLAAECAQHERLLVIKTHPSEADLSLYEGLAREFPGTVSVVRHGERDLRELLGECALLVTRYSTVAMEAALQAIPVIVVYPAGGAERYPFAAEGVAVAVSSPGEMRDAVAMLLQRPAPRYEERREEFLRAHVGPLDGEATRRAAAVIARAAAGRNH